MKGGLTLDFLLFEVTRLFNV